MLIELRASDDRLRGPKAMDPAPILMAAYRAAVDSETDLSQLRVVCDFIQYRQNFREPVELRRVQSSDGSETWEIAIDLRRATPEVVHSSIKTRASARLALEPWGPASGSLIWGFNTLYWKALSLWEQVTGRGYESALPSGQSDARNVEAARELISHLFDVWDGLASRRALPEELYVLEIGVGNGSQATVFLDELRGMASEQGRDYYRRVHYLMGDYSPHVLELARQSVAHHSEKISSLALDALRPTLTLGFLRSKAFLVYISNVYDNLPTDEIVRIGSHLLQVQTRAVFSRSSAEALSSRFKTRVEDLPDLIARLLRLGPELLSEVLPDTFSTALDAVQFWRAAWEGLRLEERYVPLVELDAYDFAPDLGDDVLRSVVESDGDLRMHTSNGAAASFADTLPLLHPHGILQCHDLFVTDVHQYLDGFRGPGKYDGSIVNWVNGRLLAAIGSRRGFDVSFAPFAHRVGSNVMTMSARARE